MPAKSKKQQKFMAMVHQCQKNGNCASKEVADTAKGMKRKDAKDFASTKHTGLPEKKKSKSKKTTKVKENTMKDEKKLMVEFINGVCNKEYSAAKNNLKKLVDIKFKNKIKKIADETA